MAACCSGGGSTGWAAGCAAGCSDGAAAGCCAFAAPMPNAAAQMAIARARATVLGRAKALTRKTIPVQDRKVRCILYEVNAAVSLAPLSIDAEIILDLDQISIDMLDALEDAAMQHSVEGARRSSEKAAAPGRARRRTLTNVVRSLFPVTTWLRVTRRAFARCSSGCCRPSRSRLSCPLCQ